MNTETNELKEEKFSKTRAGVNAVTGWKSASHFGMDLPVGGLGNPAPVTTTGLFIGPSGTPYRVSDKRGEHKANYITEIQHGHLYVNVCEHHLPAVAAPAAPCHSTSNQSSVALDVQISAAIKIQKVWRGWQARQRMIRNEE